jgi:hypothetical protein
MLDGLPGRNEPCSSMDEEKVADARGLLRALLAERFGSDRWLSALRNDQAGSAKQGRKVLSLVWPITLGAGCIEFDVLRSGGEAALAHPAAAPSTLETLLRASTLSWAPMFVEDPARAGRNAPRLVRHWPGLPSAGRTYLIGALPHSASRPRSPESPRLAAACRLARDREAQRSPCPASSGWSSGPPTRWCRGRLVPH